MVGSRRYPTMAPTARAAVLLALTLACVEYRRAPAGPAAGVTAVEIVAGASHTCARMADGTVRCWGANEFGQLGDGSTTARSRPVPVVGLRDVGMLALGEGHTCALVGDGSVRCWGRNAVGQLGASVADRSLTPVPVQNLTAVEAIAAGDDHTCARLQDGSVRCWGLNDEGQLGGDDAAFRDTPVAVRDPAGTTNLTGVAGLAAGERHTCARMAAGGALCWGLNAFGELGDGTRVGRRLPAPVMNLGALEAIAAGERHTCARLDTQRVRCWGGNGDGQLGDGSTTDRDVPVDARGVEMAIAVRAGVTHSCALLDDQTVRCWGRDVEGQLGEVSIAVDGGGTIRSPGLGFVEEITAGAQHTCARLNNNEVRCWGANGSGQLGDGTVETRRTPVRVAW